MSRLILGLIMMMRPVIMILRLRYLMFVSEGGELERIGSMKVEGEDRLGKEGLVL